MPSISDDQLEVVIPEVVSSEEAPRTASNSSRTVRPDLLLETGRQDFNFNTSIPKSLRLKTALLLAASGILMLGIGLLFTLSIIGALIGIPLMLAGIGTLAIAVLALLAKRSSRFVHIRFP